MTKKKGIFDVSVSTEILKPKKETIAKGMEVEKALSIIERQMQSERVTLILKIRL